MPGNYCPDCTHFVSLEPEEVECDDLEVEDHGNGSGEITGSVRLVLNCAECSTEMKEAYPDVCISFEHECTDEINEDFDEGDTKYEIESAEGEPTDWMQTHDRSGKPIKGPMRYRKHFYGADLNINVNCLRCGDSFEVVTSEAERPYEQASGFDELN